MSPESDSGLGGELLRPVQLLLGAIIVQAIDWFRGWAEEELERNGLAQFPGLRSGIFFTRDSRKIFP